MGPIVILAAGNERGGAASHILTYAQAALDAGVLDKVRFVLLGGGYLANRLVALVGDPFCSVIESGFRGAVSELRRTVRELDCPLVHAHGPRVNVLSRLTLGRGLAWTSTLHSHMDKDYTGSRWKSILLPRVNRWALQSTVGVFVVNPEFGKFLPRKPAIVVPNSIQVHSLQGPPEMYQLRLRETMGVPSDATVFGIAARFDPIKDIVTLLKALALIEREDVHIAIAGDGAEREAICAQIDHLKLNHRVHLLGFLDNIHEFYAGLTAHVLPSRSEGMPSSILEAGAVGVPNIGSDIQGITRLITHGETGLCFKVGDANDLSRQMQNLLDNPHLASSLSERFRVEVLPKYTPEVMLRTYMEGYSRLTS